MKRVIICIIVALCCMTPAFGLELSAHSAILMDADTGAVLYEKNPDERSLIASTTKIMTALVVLEQAELSDPVLVPAEAAGVEGSSMYLKAGERLSVEDLLHGLMLASGNDAAVALAIHISGSVDAFAELMNQKAEELGLNNAHFSNPNGLDSQGNYATARDLGKLGRAALQNQEFRRIVSRKSYHCTGHDLINHNKLLWQYEGALGIKTGFTKKAGRILVGAAEQKGRTLVSVTVYAPDDWQDHKKLLDYGFEQYSNQQAISAAQVLGTIPVISGQENQVDVLAQEEILCWLLPGEKPRVELQIPPFLYAPVEQGNHVGSAEVYLGDKKIATVPVYTASSVQQQQEEPGFLEKIFQKLGNE